MRSSFAARTRKAHGAQRRDRARPRTITYAVVSGRLPTADCSLPTAAAPTLLAANDQTPIGALAHGHHAGAFFAHPAAAARALSLRRDLEALHVIRNVRKLPHQ